MLIQSKSPWGAKDVLKASCCSWYLGWGSPNSSTEYYRQQLIDKANCPDQWNAGDYVFISSEGQRVNRYFPLMMYKKAIQMGKEKMALFVTDSPFHRMRGYNIGERQISDILSEEGFVETAAHKDYSLWLPPQP